MRHSNSPLVVHKQVGRIKLAPKVQPSSDSTDIKIVVTNFNKLIEKVPSSDQIITLSSHMKLALNVCIFLTVLL